MSLIEVLGVVVVVVVIIVVIVSMSSRCSSFTTIAWNGTE